MEKYKVGKKEKVSVWNCFHYFHLFSFTYTYIKWNEMQTEDWRNYSKEKGERFLSFEDAAGIRGLIFRKNYRKLYFGNRKV